MSLNWDVSKCENHEELIEENSLAWAITNAFIWKTMVTGLGKNWSLDAEFAPGQPVGVPEERRHGRPRPRRSEVRQEDRVRHHDGLKSPAHGRGCGRVRVPGGRRAVMRKPRQRGDR